MVKITPDNHNIHLLEYSIVNVGWISTCKKKEWSTDFIKYKTNGSTDICVNSLKSKKKVCFYSLDWRVTFFLHLLSPHSWNRSGPAKAGRYFQAIYRWLKKVAPNNTHLHIFCQVFVSIDYCNNISRTCTCTRGGNLLNRKNSKPAGSNSVSPFPLFK
jgi:hypothetical protein